MWEDFKIFLRRNESRLLLSYTSFNNVPMSAHPYAVLSGGVSLVDKV